MSGYLRRLVERARGAEAPLVPTPMPAGRDAGPGGVVDDPFERALYAPPAQPVAGDLATPRSVAPPPPSALLPERVARTARDAAEPSPRGAARPPSSRRPRTEPPPVADAPSPAPVGLVPNAPAQAPSTPPAPRRSTLQPAAQEPPPLAPPARAAAPATSGASPVFDTPVALDASPRGEPAATVTAVAPRRSGTPALRVPADASGPPGPVPPALEAGSVMSGNRVTPAPREVPAVSPAPAARRPAGDTTATPPPALAPPAIVDRAPLTAAPAGPALTIGQLRVEVVPPPRAEPPAVPARARRARSATPTRAPGSGRRFGLGQL